LFIAQQVEELPDRLLGSNLKCGTKCLVRKVDPQVGVQHQQRSWDVFKNRLEIPLAALHGVDVLQRQHHAIDHIILRAIWQDAQFVPAVLQVTYLTLERLEAVQDLRDLQLEIMRCYVQLLDIEFDIGKWPPNVSGHHFEQLGSLGRDPSYVKPAVQHDNRNSRTVQQIQNVVAQVMELAVLIA